MRIAWRALFIQIKYNTMVADILKTLSRYSYSYTSRKLRVHIILDIILIFQNYKLKIFNFLPNSAQYETRQRVHKIICNISFWFFESKWPLEKNIDDLLVSSSYIYLNVYNSKVSSSHMRSPSNRDCHNTYLLSSMWDKKKISSVKKNLKHFKQED